MVWIDLTRIKVVQQNSRAIFISFLEALQLLFQAPLRYFVAILTVCFLTIFIMLSFHLVKTTFSIDSSIEILIGFFLIQVSVFLQLLIKLSRFGVYVKLTNLLSIPNDYNIEDIGIIKHDND
jgi:hypothetical protein